MNQPDLFDFVAAVTPETTKPVWPPDNYGRRGDDLGFYLRHGYHQRQETPAQRQRRMRANGGAK